MRIHCNKKWGLSRNTLILLYKSLVFPTLLYCAPVWANQNIKKLESSIVHQSRSFRDKVLSESNSYRSATGHTSKDIVVQNISANFLTKVLQYHDHLRKRVIEQQNSLINITTLRNIKIQFYNLKYIDLYDERPKLHRSRE